MDIHIYHQNSSPKEYLHRYSIKKHVQSLLHASNKAGVKVNIGITTYIEALKRQVLLTHDTSL